MPQISTTSLAATTARIEAHAMIPKLIEDALRGAAESKASPFARRSMYWPRCCRPLVCGGVCLLVEYREHLRLEVPHSCICGHQEGVTADDQRLVFDEPPAWTTRMHPTPPADVRPPGFYWARQHVQGKALAPEIALWTPAWVETRGSSSADVRWPGHWDFAGHDDGVPEGEDNDHYRLEVLAGPLEPPRVSP